MDTDDRRRRVKAARALTPPSPAELERRKPKTQAEPGITTNELSERINQPGLSFKTIGNIERGDKTPNRGDLLLIAEATGLPVEFFTLERDDLLRRLGGGAVPAIQGELGRRLQDVEPSRATDPQSQTDAAADK